MSGFVPAVHCACTIYVLRRPSATTHLLLVVEGDRNKHSNATSYDTPARTQVLDLLRKNPVKAVPTILARLEQKGQVGGRLVGWLADRVDE
jgi:hypothetical protein